MQANKSINSAEPHKFICPKVQYKYITYDKYVFYYYIKMHLLDSNNYHTYGADSQLLLYEKRRLKKK